MKALLAVLLAVFVLGFQIDAEASRRYPPRHPHHPHHPQPYPYPYPAPYPSHPGYVTCYAQGLANGAVFYGVGINPYVATQFAFNACNMSGQYCQLLYCQY